MDEAGELALGLSRELHGKGRLGFARFLAMFLGSYQGVSDVGHDLLDRRALEDVVWRSDEEVALAVDDGDVRHRGLEQVAVLVELESLVAAVLLREVRHERVRQVARRLRRTQVEHRVIGADRVLLDALRELTYLQTADEGRAVERTLLILNWIKEYG